MSDPALLLTASDFLPLRESLNEIDGALQAVRDATLAHFEGRVRQIAIADDTPSPQGMNSLRLSLAAGVNMDSGFRVFGNPPHSRFYVLLDGETRRLLALMDYGVLNSLRVGAIAGLAAQHLAPSGAHSVGLLGSGWQTRTQLQALRRVLPAIDLVRVYSPTPAHRERFAAEMSDWLDVRVEPVSSVAAAIDEADIVDVAAPGHADHREPFLDGTGIRPGALVISTAGSQSTESFVRSSRVVVGTWQGMKDDPSPRPPYTAWIRAGEFARSDVTELGAILTGRVEPRQKDDETVIYELNPVYVHDLYVATWGLGWARDHGLRSAPRC